MRDFDTVSRSLAPRMTVNNAGFWAPDGWLDLVVEMDTRLQANPDYRIAQVKEKFGRLCFYADGLTADEREYVRQMEERSLAVCQGCGSTENVKMRDHGWVATMCAQCWQRPQCPRSRGYGQLSAALPCSMGCECMTERDCCVAA